MIKGLLKGITEAYIDVLQMENNEELSSDINFDIRRVINKHSGFRIGSKVHYTPSKKDRMFFNKKFVPNEHIGIVTKMHITEEIRELATSKEQANVDTKIYVGVLQFTIFVPEDNACYVVNIDEFNTYKDNIDFVCEESYND